MSNGEVPGLDSREWTAPGSMPAAPPPAPPASSPVATPSSPVAPPPVPQGTMPGPAPAPTFRSWKPGIIALRPLGFGDFLSVPFRAMRFNRAVVIGGPLLISLATALAMSVTLWMLYHEPMWSTLDPVSGATSVGPRGETLAMAAVTVLLMLVGDVLATGIVTPGVARAVLGERITLGQAWAELRPRLGALAVLWLLTSGALLVALGIASIPLILGIAAGDGGAILLGYLLTLAVALLVGLAATFFSALARPIVVLERRGPIAAITRGLRLIKGRFWWTVLILAVGIILITIAASVLQQVAGIGAVVVLALGPTEGTMMIGFLVVMALGLTISTTATYAYLGALYPLILIDLRIRHEGFDLTLAEAAEARQHA